MTTLSEDSDSWKAGGVIRRDFRATKDGPEVPKPGKNKRKNLKRWCRGKEGKEHKWIIIRREFSFGANVFLHDKCSECGKETNWRNG